MKTGGGGRGIGWEGKGRGRGGEEVLHQIQASLYNKAPRKPTSDEKVRGVYTLKLSRFDSATVDPPVLSLYIVEF